MKVIEIDVSKHYDAHDKISMLQLLREDIGANAFRSAVAKVLVKHQIELKRYRRKEVNRMDVLFLVNARLRELGCEEISYSYVKKIDESIKL